jgi:purine-binding chemotaxis protein CheW
MKNTELLERIEAEHTRDNEQDAGQTENVIKFLIVQIKERKYAFYAEQIREIVMDVPLYFVPFVPPYIRGFINRHGEPYSVFDLHELFEDEPLDSATFLISNFHNDQVAFLVSSVVEILKLPESQVHLLTSTEDRDTFFLGAIDSKGEEVFILNLTNIIRRLANDLESS